MTEVSCWAALNKVDLTSTEPIDLGRPLSSTRLMVVDDKGLEMARQGEGSLLIAGQRIEPDPPVETGDRVEVINGRLFYRGRTDGTVKRQGKRLNLHSVELTALASGLVRQCCALIHRHLLLLAAVLSGPASHLEAYYADNSASHEIPDEIVQLDAIPVTGHGKIDRQALLDTIGKRFQPDRRDWESILAAEWPHQAVQPDSNFIQSGGDSLQAVRLSARLQERLDRPLTGLVDVLLNRSYVHVRRYIQQEVDRPRDGDPAELNASSVHQTSRKTFTPAGRTLVLDWTFDMEKCIDASPLIIES